MIIKAGYNICFECEAPTPILLMLNVHPSREPDLLTKDEIRLSPPGPSRNYIDSFGNRVTRCTLPPGKTEITSDFLIKDSGRPDVRVPDAAQVPIEQLPDDIMLFLVASRYCDSDHFLDLAWELFGARRPGWDRVSAICDYVHNRLEFGYQHACATRTASSGHTEQVGVCRDFAHLAIALCRAMNIPARYATGYLGDIGVPADPAPMDFSAWFETYLGGTWYTFDARHNKPRIGRVVMARGRDAADCALTTSFGKSKLVNFTVVTEEAPDR
jgi:transglutaminase-like putative cysteine protease